MSHEIVATWSPCCHMLREGKQPPGVMHNGLCRDRHKGVLGPAVYLKVDSVDPSGAALSEATPTRPFGESRPHGGYIHERGRPKKI